MEFMLHNARERNPKIKGWTNLDEFESQRRTFTIREFRKKVWHWNALF